MGTDFQKITETDKEKVASYMTIRKNIGKLGVLLPIILSVGLYLFGNCNTAVLNSISDYYYTTMGKVMVAVLSAFALFLFSYRGYDRHDRIAFRTAGSFALIAAFLPTDIKLPPSSCDIITESSSSFIATVHLISAGLFLLTLAYISIFLFTKKGDNTTNEKTLRDKIYKICGYILIASVFLCFLYLKLPIDHEKFNHLHPVFWLETIALWAFGLSWLTKGQFWLKDKTLPTVSE